MAVSKTSALPLLPPQRHARWLSRAEWRANPKAQRGEGRPTAQALQTSLAPPTQAGRIIRIASEDPVEAALHLLGVYVRRADGQVGDRPSVVIQRFPPQQNLALPGQLAQGLL